MLDVGFSELKSAFYAHGASSKNKVEPSDFLILFYAVECGLKAVILKENRSMKISGTMNNELVTHDLRLLIKRLGWPASVSSGNANFRIQRDNSSWTIGYAHEAWRYGVKIMEDDQHQLTTWLDNLKTKIAMRI